MKKEEKKSKRPVGPFSFCPKHKVFFASCKCAYRKEVKVEMEVEPIKEKLLQ